MGEALLNQRGHVCIGGYLRTDSARIAAGMANVVVVISLATTVSIAIAIGIGNRKNGIATIPTITDIIVENTEFPGEVHRHGIFVWATVTVTVTGNVYGKW